MFFKLICDYFCHETYVMSSFKLESNKCQWIEDMYLKVFRNIFPKESTDFQHPIISIYFDWVEWNLSNKQLILYFHILDFILWQRIQSNYYFKSLTYGDTNTFYFSFSLLSLLKLRFVKTSVWNGNSFNVWHHYFLRITMIKNDLHLSAVVAWQLFITAISTSGNFCRSFWMP